MTSALVDTLENFNDATTLQRFVTERKTHEILRVKGVIDCREMARQLLERLRVFA